MSNIFFLLFLHPPSVSGCLLLSVIAQSAPAGSRRGEGLERESRRRLRLAWHGGPVRTTPWHDPTGVGVACSGTTSEAGQCWGSMLWPRWRSLAEQGGSKARHSQTVMACWPAARGQRRGADNRGEGEERRREDEESEKIV